MNFLFFIFCIFIGNVASMFSQDYSEICATEDVVTTYAYFDNDPNYLNTLDPLVVNVAFWGVTPPNGGSDPDDLTEQKALEAIPDLL